MDTLYKITFGTELDKDGNRIEVEVMVIDSILEDIAQNMGGYTLINHSGGYMHHNGSLAIEESSTIEILGSSENIDFIKHIAGLIKKAYNQESVIVAAQAYSVEFI